MKKLAAIIRNEADKIIQAEDEPEAAKTAARLAVCLARALERGHLDLEQVYVICGSPGDWGYTTPVGKALYALYSNDSDDEATKPQESRYSFRMADGSLPMSAGKLSWMSDRNKTEESARRWGSKTLLILARSTDGSWVISEEVPLS